MKTKKYKLDLFLFLCLIIYPIFMIWALYSQSEIIFFIFASLFIIANIIYPLYFLFSILKKSVNKLLLISLILWLLELYFYYWLIDRIEYYKYN